LLKSLGVAMAGQTDRFVPADKRMYALRDVTATVESIPLIAASIMSKKLAEGCDALVLDIKVGNGAFMATPEQARRLARTMIALGSAMDRRVATLLTDMDQPTGRAIGNACEVIEAVECLRGEWPSDDLKVVTTELAITMLQLAGVEKSRRGASDRLARALETGAALERFRALVEAQGGDPRVIDDPRRLKLAPRQAVIAAPRAGHVAGFDTRGIGLAACALGAGRATKESAIDPSVSLWMNVKRGDRVAKGDALITVRYRKESAWNEVRAGLAACVRIEVEPAPAGKPILQSLG
jgi:pyrimidine-nucleoside phosphorylase